MKHKSFLNLRITWVIALILFLVHIYFSWALPFEGNNFAVILGTFIISPFIVVFLWVGSLRFEKLRNVYVLGLIYLFIGIWCIEMVHMFIDKPL